jgi:hypothetical protein
MCPMWCRRQRPGDEQRVLAEHYTLVAFTLSLIGAGDVVVLLCGVMSCWAPTQNTQTETDRTAQKRLTRQATPPGTDNKTTEANKIANHTRRHKPFHTPTPKHDTTPQKPRMSDDQQDNNGGGGDWTFCFFYTIHSFIAHLRCPNPWIFHTSIYH